MKPFLHSKIHAKKYGGAPDDYADIDDFIDKMIQSSEMEDIMMEMFGDHVIITATRDGFDVNEYEHD